MDMTQIVMLLHLIGFGLLLTTTVAGSLLNAQYKKSTDFKTRLVILGSMRRIGLLSPIGVLIILITGIGNMHARGLGLFTESWLTMKILLFAIAAIAGIVFGIRAGKRGKMVMQLSEGNAPAGLDGVVASIDRQMRIFYIVQALLMLLILILTVVKPGRYL